MSFQKKIYWFFLPVFLNPLFPVTICAQTNLLLNGGFEDINTCTEYNAECGVEAWFYLRDVKAEMLANENNLPVLGSNSLAIFFNWSGYTGFSPVIGTILPCRLKNNTRYTFKGMLMAKLSGRLILKPGIAIGEKFFVPKKSFSANMQPDTILQVIPVSKTNFYQFEFSFLASGTEKYLTFGTFIKEDTLSGKKNPIGSRTISLTLDNFELLSADNNEIVCGDFIKNKEKIYNYNFRHKEMDYSLFGKGEIAIHFDETDSNYLTRHEIPKDTVRQPAKADTLKLGDVFFDFNKARLKPEAFIMLEKFFRPDRQNQTIDSIYIEGHTDSIGSDARNLQLSLQRCESVQQWLRQKNIISAGGIQIHPFGKTKPIATNSTSRGRAMNRRVELIIFREKK